MTAALPQPIKPIPSRLPAHLFTPALPCGRDRRRGRAQRSDGWTPPRIRAFLGALAQSGSVAHAARAAGMSRQSAYALRANAKGRAFDDAWRSALLAAAPAIPDQLMERALRGQVDPVIRDGKLRSQRHHFDNRLAMQVLRRLDRVAQSQSCAARTLQALAADFDAFVHVVAFGDAHQADAFIRAHAPRGVRPSTLPASAPRPGAQTSNVSTLPHEPRAFQQSADSRL